MVSARRRRQRGQALVEFALVGTMLIMVLLVVLDFGRGLFFYTEMATGAREMARQAVLEYNAQSNTAAPGCSPCAVPGIMPQLQSIAGIGYGPPVYSLSPSAGSPPSYGTYLAGAPAQPGTIGLSSTALVNTMYVFIYELDPTTGATNWATCDPCAGTRTGNGKLVVVDLKIRWQPIVLSYVGGASSITFDAQTVSREEW
jgi:hypothetical protein